MFTFRTIFKTVKIFKIVIQITQPVLLSFISVEWSKILGISIKSLTNSQPYLLYMKQCPTQTNVPCLILVRYTAKKRMFSPLEARKLIFVALTLYFRAFTRRNFFFLILSITSLKLRQSEGQLPRIEVPCLQALLFTATVVHKLFL